MKKALRFYTGRYHHWVSLRGGAPKLANHRGSKCPRYLLRIRQAKAAQAHRQWNRYFIYHWAWSEWLPDKWQRIAKCETPITVNGHRTMNWKHYNSTYQGAFGFHRQSWDAFVPRADPKAGPYPSDANIATPRQQYEVALAIYRMYGFSGWGCRGA